MEKEDVQKTISKAIKDREKTKINRVHGGKIDDTKVWVDGKFISKEKVGKVHRDNFLGIDIIHA